MASASTEAQPWTADADALALGFDTDLARGLSPEQVAERRAEFGPNELEEEPVSPPWRIFLAQFVNTMIVVLLVAAGVMVAIGEPTDAIVIAAIVILNAVIGFVQEYRAEQAMAAKRPPIMA